MGKEQNNSEKSTDFAKFCENTQKNLKKYVLRLQNNDIYAAEEIVQDTYEFAMKKKDVVMSHPNPEGWLFEVAKNFSKKYNQKKRKTRANETELTENIIIPTDSYSELIESILSALTDREKVFFESHYIDRVSILEIADQTGEKYDNLKKFSSRLKAKLKKIIMNKM